jgi:1,4-alpha-glucan branching enzyme
VKYTETAPLRAYLAAAVVVVDGEQMVRRSRVYTDIGSARKALAYMGNEWGVRYRDGWIETASLAWGLAEDGGTPGPRRRCRECGKFTNTVKDRWLRPDGGRIRYCCDCFDVLIERLDRMEVES